MSDYRFKIRRGTTAQWDTANPVLLEGEPGVDTTLDRMKVGDGSSTWADLPYIDSAGLSEKADAADVAAQLQTKANASSVGALSTRVDTTETRVGTVEDELGGRLAPAVLNSTIATAVAGRASRPGAVTSIIGDSTTRGSDSQLTIDGATITKAGESWFSWACYLSGQRIRRGRNAGVIGNTSTQMLARIDADVINQTPRPNNCIVYAGTNDAGAGTTAVPLADYAANIRAMVDKLRTGGVLPILCTTFASNNSPKYQALDGYNTFLRRYAAEQGLMLIDLHAFTVEPSTGALKAGYSSDGVHLSVAGYRAVGQFVADTITALMPTSTLDVVDNTQDPNNLALNGLFQGSQGSGSDVRATSWGRWGALPTGATLSLVDGPAGVLGKMQRLDAVGTSAEVQVYQSISTNVAAGDRLAFSGAFNFVGNGSTNGTIWVDFGSSTGAPYVIPLSLTVTGSGRYYVETTAPAGTNALHCRLRLFGGTATMDIGQFTVRNLTRMGLA